MEEHYSIGVKCESSNTPLNKHEIGVVENLIKKFHGSTKKKRDVTLDVVPGHLHADGASD